jgi:hypothetical protein
MKKDNTKKEKHIALKKPNRFVFWLFKTASKFAAKFLYNCKIGKNELKGSKGRRVLIVNHESAIDFIFVGASLRENAHMVISSSFYQSVPSMYQFLKRSGVIPKNQFQTSLTDMRLMKQAVESERPLILYPAGLMTESGESTLIPNATGKTLKWLDADIYLAKISGSYLTKPKWSAVKRKGKITIDITKFMDREQVKALSNEEMQTAITDALYFDAYKHNDVKRVEYKNGDNVEGLEHVLFRCPKCGKEYGLQVSGKNALICDACGLTLTADKCGLFTVTGIDNPDFKYASTIYNKIVADYSEEIKNDQNFRLETSAEVHMINDKKHKYVPVGNAKVTLDKENLILDGDINGQPFYKEIFSGSYPILPFIPGKRFEIQDGSTIYRIVPKDGKCVTKWITAFKTLFNIHKDAISH